MHHLKIEEVYKKLNSSSNGLTSKQVDENLKTYGRNLLPKKKQDSFLKIFFM